MHRWKIWKRFDVVTRIFGSGDKESEPEAVTPAPVTDATMAALASMFGQNFMQQPEETSK